MPRPPYIGFPHVGTRFRRWFHPDEAIYQLRGKIVGVRINNVNYNMTIFDKKLYLFRDADFSPPIAPIFDPVSFPTKSLSDRLKLWQFANITI